METTKNKPLASPKEDTLVGNGMSKREARKIRMQSMNKSEIAYMRRKRVFDAVWPFFRFFILFGLCFVILYPLIYMISCAFRDSADMSDPTVMWIPRHLTLNVIKETADVMDIWNTLKTTLLLNVGCSLVQVASCALAGYGFARFKFKGKGILFGIVFTKADKLSKTQCTKSVERYKATLGEQWEELPPMFVSSGERGTGREEILGFIGGCLDV